VIARNGETYESCRTKLLGQTDTSQSQPVELDGVGQFEARLEQRLRDAAVAFSGLRESLEQCFGELFLVDELMKKAGSVAVPHSHNVQFCFVVDSGDCFDDFACCFILAKWFGSQVTVLSSLACCSRLQPVSNVLVAADLSLFPQHSLQRFSHRLQVVAGLGEGPDKLDLCREWNQRAGAPMSRLASVYQLFFKVPLALQASVKQHQDQTVLRVGSWFEPEKTRKLIKRTGLFLDLSFIEYSSIFDLALEPEAVYDCIFYKFKTQAKFQQLAEYVQKRKAVGRKVLLSNDLESFNSFRKRELGIELLRKIASSEQVQRALSPEESSGTQHRRVRVPQTVKLSLASQPSIEVFVVQPESD
jgi:hypothetical protein